MDNPNQQPSTPPSSAPTTPVKQSSSGYGKHGWKKWLVIYIVIGILLYAGIYYFVLGKQATKPYSTDYNYVQPTRTAQPTTTQQQAVDTLNWKTYTNTKHGYTLKYPPDWYEIDYTDNGDLILSSKTFSDVKTKLDLEERDPNASLLWVQVLKGGVTDRVPADAYFNLIKAQKPGSVRETGVIYKITKLEDLTIDGLPAVKQIEEPKEGAQTDIFGGVHVYVLKNDKLYAIAIDKNGWGKYQNIFNQILSTFTFD